MNTPLVLSATALGASLYLLGTPKARTLAIGAAVVSGIVLASALGFVRVTFAHVDVILTAALAALGVLLVMRVDAKAKVVAATLVAAIGIVQTLSALF